MLVNFQFAIALKATVYSYAYDWSEQFEDLRQQEIQHNCFMTIWRMHC